ncbi:MAG: urate oxidase [Pseudonocardiales bacterium]|jgi:urate oxidase|nr:putative urate oxidase [Pseudonocardia sp.]MDT7562329.1 urate oxidase [Pseudonocardiales bacterium]MDT7585250.1 urate oxidase [Pseudonocardiales bacterium]MDT7643086.1 urate oxidase [Pseudonocardiales bacterium]MDT7671051.1 urate oxidase [Pseudonocardiales bacterium]
MTIVLGPNQYGKAENRVVRLYRDGARHEIRDVNVSTSLRGEFSDAHLAGDQSRVLPTDTQKNTVYAYAKEKGLGQIEDYALELARHFVDDVEPVQGARIEIDEYAWDRIEVDGRPHDHSFVRRGQETRTTIVTLDGKDAAQRAWVVSGLKDLVVLKSTGSEFHGFLTDPYTTLRETTDRVMATSLVARWRYVGTDVDWDASYASIRSLLLTRFAQVHSLALQQTLWEMGKAVLEEHDRVAEIKFSAPNKHHFVVDLAPFGLDNPNEVFHADDRPYGLIQTTVLRDDAPDAGLAWYTVPGFA